ncbi:hypothetical protein GOEFS_106_00030 [Gordonia effusa NBRC 100432]|uniref:Uncharacterized protein n=1 Tax=Gordonia effusa NBRC 100432 TaxID=1077974 RepID=H0R4V6_9ACTN|nr:hypothetical protein GOEFS_106_00030 [Gordonia effusa NBRC 100432]
MVDHIQSRPGNIVIRLASQLLRGALGVLNCFRVLLTALALVLGVVCISGMQLGVALYGLTDKSIGGAGRYVKNLVPGGYSSRDQR